MKGRACLSFLVLVVTNEASAFSATSTPPSSNLQKVEAAAVKRFKNYDKLCKTCPTLLQPRVDTLTEMIMNGLTRDERDELLAKVAARMLQQEEDDVSHGNTPRIQTAKDVFKFQTGQDADLGPDEQVRAQDDDDDDDEVLLAENKDSSFKKEKILVIDKAKSKFDTNKLKLDRMKRLVEATNSLLAGNKNANYTTTMTSDSNIYHSIDELQGMSRTELKMQRLKYLAQQAKLEQKLAKGRMKLYGATLALAEK